MIAATENYIKRRKITNFDCINYYVVDVLRTTNVRRGFGLDVGAKGVRMCAPKELNPSMLGSAHSTFLRMDSAPIRIDFGSGKSVISTTRIRVMF